MARPAGFVEGCESLVDEENVHGLILPKEVMGYE
jgi:hypothetical protein